VQKLNLQELATMTNTVRKHIIRMLGEAGSGHPGGSLSAVEIVTALYFHVLRHDPRRPDWPDRDRFILSKGHGVPVQYACLAEAGYFPVEELKTLRKINSRLQGHPVKGTVPGIEASTGSLGQGLSIALGHALAGKLDGKDYRVYVMIGDGESDEGQIWEAALFGAHHKLDNLVAILDYNKIQLDGRLEEILELAPLADKWRAFGWHVLEIDGHDLAAILAAFAEAERTKGKPSILIAHTIKGKGVSFMEDDVEWHGIAPNAEQVERALAELEQND
jgi:transketolase